MQHYRQTEGIAYQNFRQTVALVLEETGETPKKQRYLSGIVTVMFVARVACV
jgi:hypothetical protein